VTNGTRLARSQHVNLRNASDLAAPPSCIDTDASYSRRRSAWHQAQQQYWNEVAHKYDHLYEGRWSRMENAWVALRLSFIADLVQPTIVDLGCGTGLGRRLVEQVNPYAEYFGVDISPSMVHVAEETEGAHFTTGSMDDLRFLVDDSSADVVIALFASFSFAFEPAQVFSEISRILRPSGYAYLSVLSRRALSRLGGCATARNARYQTRRDRRPGAGTAAHFLSIEDMQHLAHMLDMSIISAEGINTLSGVCELPCMWRVGRLIAWIYPQSSHLIDMIFQKAG
jgi:SAM-dependent methyltransferase